MRHMLTIAVLALSTSAALAQVPAPPFAPKSAKQGAAKTDGTVQMAAVSGPRAAANTIQRINDYFNSFKTMIGDFVQVDPDGTRRTGEFYILSPAGCCSNTPRRAGSSWWPMAARWRCATRS